ncbi:MAG TPA: glycosyltransferase [Candidatus Sumerlaeota bacterium]|nr:glycosyltransferase [Candidatus Sumerlaeota bacterium]
MKVALVHDWLNGMRGGEKVLEVFCDLFPKADLFTLFYEPAAVSEKIRAMRPRASGLQKLPGVRRWYRLLLPLYPRAVERFDLSGYDLVISISHCAAKGVKKAPRARHVCYCLTPMRYVWDRYDDYFGHKSRLSAIRLAMDLARKGLQKWDVKTAAGVDFFIATSEYIAQRIRNCFARESRIIHPPADTVFFTPATVPVKPGGEYFLVTSALVPYKKVDIAVEAFRGRKERLIVAGNGPERKRLEAMAPPNVEFAGWVTDEGMRDLYRNCRAFVFPPEEDFGIAPIEAMACGRPVIAYGGGGALETVAGGKTGMFFHRQTPASLAEALDHFRPDDYDPAACREQALLFSRERCLEGLRSFLMDEVNISC